MESPVDPPRIDGEHINFVAAPTLHPQATKLHSVLVDYLTRERVLPEQITILVADAMHKLDYYNELVQLPLPRGVRWLQEGQRQANAVLMDTIQRFKGLESEVVFIWGLDHISLPRDHELLYVGMSRATSVLLLVAKQEVVRALQQRAQA